MPCLRSMWAFFLSNHDAAYAAVERPDGLIAHLVEHPDVHMLLDPEGQGPTLAAHLRVSKASVLRLHKGSGYSRHCVSLTTGTCWKLV